jgi:hypothetical protein
VAIAGDVAYVATRIPSKHTSLGRLEVVRLTGPGAPALAGGLELPSGATSVAVGGNFAYLTDELSGLFVVDVVSPIAPRLIGASGLPVGAKACHFTGDHLLLVDRDGLTVHRPQCGSVQPVTLASLTAELEPGGSVRLQFYAAPDGGFLQFDVERAPARTGPPPNGFVRIASLPVDGPRAGWREVRDAPPPGAAYAYRVTAIGSDGSRERLGPIVVEVPAAREAVRLAVWPNPAGAGTAIRIASSADGPGVLAVFDVTGRRVAELWSGSLAPGSHVFRWDGRDAGGRLLPNGAYFVRWQTARSERSERLTIIR